MKYINQNQIHEFSTRFIGYNFSAVICYRKGLWLIFNCTTFNVLWMGARRNCSTCHIEQPELKEHETIKTSSYHFCISAGGSL